MVESTVTQQQIIDDLAARHTAKKYDETKQVSQVDLDVLYEALRLSPSSINSQPWKFIVIESEAAKQRMHSTFARKFQFNQAHVLACSQIILFAHNPVYQRDDYEKIIDIDIALQRTPAVQKQEAFAKYAFVEMNTDHEGCNSAWTKAQTYIALGNALHTLARLKIDATPMEGVDSELISEVFADELAGYRCELALAIGFHHPVEDYNAKLPKSRLPKASVLRVI